MMPGCRIIEVTRASTKSRLTASASRVRSGDRTLIAARRAIRWCSARYTSPMLPSPRRERARKLPKRSPSTHANVDTRTALVNWVSRTNASVLLHGSWFTESRASNRAQERAAVDRLRQVGIEAGAQRAHLLARAGRAGHRDQAGRSGAAEHAYLLRDREAVEIRQIDVEQHDIRIGLADPIQRRAPAIDGLHGVPLQLQEHLECAANLRVVVD